jgi:hypothetical protein
MTSTRSRDRDPSCATCDHRYFERAPARDSARRELAHLRYLGVEAGGTDDPRPGRGVPSKHGWLLDELAEVVRWRRRAP